jgi:hypothetical protein
MVEHQKLPVSEFTPGRSYRVGMNGRPLYNAEVVKFHGGCWATVRVQECLYDAMQAEYRPGTEFDIKVAMYELELLAP